MWGRLLRMSELNERSDREGVEEIRLSSHFSSVFGTGADAAVALWIPTANGTGSRWGRVLCFSKEAGLMTLAKSARSPAKITIN